MAGLKTHTAPTATRSILLDGLYRVLIRPGVFWWSYAFQLALALLFSLATYAQFNEILAHSSQSMRLTSGFDVVTLITAAMRVRRDSPSSGLGPLVGMLLSFAVRFLMVPGTLYVLHVAAPGKLSILLGRGLAFFWRFVRITLIAGLVGAPILGVLGALSFNLATHYTDAHAGNGGLILNLCGLAVLFLGGCLLRLYFDLVEVYTVQLDDHLRASGASDRRIRRVLRPAWQTLRANFFRAYVGFVLLAALGIVAAYELSRAAVHQLPQPRVWPMFLLGQAAVLVLRTARLWQRGMETSLASGYPLVEPEEVPPAEPTYSTGPVQPTVITRLPATPGEPGMAPL